MTWEMYGYFMNKCVRDGINVPQRYISRRASFYDDIKKIIGIKASFVRPIDPKQAILHKI